MSGGVTDASEAVSTMGSGCGGPSSTWGKPDRRGNLKRLRGLGTYRDTCVRTAVACGWVLHHQQLVRRRRTALPLAITATVPYTALRV